MSGNCQCGHPLAYPHHDCDERGGEDGTMCLHDGCSCRKATAPAPSEASGTGEAKVVAECLDWVRAWGMEILHSARAVEEKLGPIRAACAQVARLQAEKDELFEASLLDHRLQRERAEQAEAEVERLKQERDAARRDRDSWLKEYQQKVSDLNAQLAKLARVEKLRAKWWPSLEDYKNPGRVRALNDCSADLRAVLRSEEKE